MHYPALVEGAKKSKRGQQAKAAIICDGFYRVLSHVDHTAAVGIMMMVRATGLPRPVGRDRARHHVLLEPLRPAGAPAPAPRREAEALRFLPRAVHAGARRCALLLELLSAAGLPEPPARRVNGATRAALGQQRHRGGRMPGWYGG